MTSVNVLVTLHEVFLNICCRHTHTHTDTHTHKGIALPLLRMRTRGNKTQAGRPETIPLCA